MQVQDTFRGSFRGRPRIYKCSTPSDPQTWELLEEGPNIVCDGMYDAVHNLLLRNFTEWSPTEISVGFGGDYSQPDDPVGSPPSDTGARVAPLASDTYVRKPIQSIPILQVTDPAVPSSTRATYIALVDPDGLTTDVGDPDKPYINELGLLAANGTLLAHYVTAADGGGNATQYTKTDLEWFVVEWEIEFVGA